MSPRSTEMRDWAPVRTTIAASLLGIATWVAAYPPIPERDASLDHTGPQLQTYTHWHDATSATERAQSSDVDFLLELLEVPAPDRIRDFLSSRSELVSLVLESLLMAPPYFPNARFTLEESVDPESDSIGISLTVVTSDLPETVLAAFERFDADWWLANMNRAEGLLSVNAQFV